MVAKITGEIYDREAIRPALSLLQASFPLAKIVIHGIVGDETFMNKD